MPQPPRTLGKWQCIHCLRLLPAVSLAMVLAWGKGMLSWSSALPAVSPAIPVTPYQHLSAVTADSAKSQEVNTPPLLAGSARGHNTSAGWGQASSHHEECVVLLLCFPRTRAGSVRKGANPKPHQALNPPLGRGGKLRHREASEAKVSCSERTQMSWLQAQIHAQLHKDRTKEKRNGCKPPPCFPPALKELPGS